MSSFEELSIMLIILMIIMPLIVELIKATKKQPPPCKECGYLVDNYQVSLSSATPVFYINHNIRFVVCQCYNKSYTVLS